MDDGHGNPSAPGRSGPWLVGTTFDDGRATRVDGLVLVTALGAADAVEVARPQLNAGEGAVLFAVEAAEFIVNPPTLSELS